MGHAMARKTTIREKILIVVFSPLVLAGLLLLLLGLPFYWLYRLLLRFVVEMLWAARGRRILLVYSRSPVWQDYIETKWLPRLRDHAVVLNWSDRATWRRTNPFAAWVFRHWAPSENFNPMAILFPRFPSTRRIAFYLAFRDWKHGNDAALREAENRLFEFVDGLRRPSA
jgi:hypothetical protein